MTGWSLPSGSGSLGTAMKNYSIIRVGNEYVVRAGDNSVLKIASRRRAAQLVTNAAELLDSLPPPADAEPTIACETTVPNPKFAIKAAVAVANFEFESTPEVYDSRVALGSEVFLENSQRK